VESVETVEQALAVESLPTESMAEGEEPPPNPHGPDPDQQ
jgi:hypothetical protein